MSHFGGEVDSTFTLKKSSRDDGAQLVSDEIAQMMSLFGSAFTITSKGIITSLIPGLTELLGDETESDNWPSLISAYTMHSWTSGNLSHYTRFRDPGLRCNVPIQPLMVSNRGVNNILVLDASDDIVTNPGGPLLSAIGWMDTNDQTSTCLKKFHDTMSQQIKTLYTSGTPDVKFKPQLFTAQLKNSEDKSNFISKLLYIPVVNNIIHGEPQAYLNRWRTWNFSADLATKIQCRTDVYTQLKYCSDNGFFDQMDMTYKPI